ncbi:glycosyltransferase family 4 protein [Methylococcus sp. EFPC2]|uniref:glycosyltransferase family 4 protein n=1 Tax=Methylococcus sp. EFPC2 TaxID=2812648 RepID=UPI0019684810|nr:MraY family glycosyltransferase [Methylococcus sp. EFPC2]QSA95531.1 undecaprenyl/decaprenyl-phosphate alpha-N-acetylglucosaminyl 1-phosphate transferase [Methylococcus sp. EFPC2]
MFYYSIFLTALFVSMVLVAILIRLAAGWKLVDIPDARKVHKGAIPRIGGIGMVLGTVAAIGAWLGFDSGPKLFLLGILIIAAFGIWDDRANLNYKIKFLGQFLAVLAVVLPGDLLIDRLSFPGCEDLPNLVSAPLTVFFLLGMTNAVNLADGLDGLAGGVSLLSLACIIALAAPADASEVILLSLAIGGSILGFLRYNTHPAVVFMGDTGSQFLGFSLGVLAIWLTQTANTALPPELPLLILGLPIVDTLTVMTQRILKGHSPFKPDRNHFHHRLLDLGLDHYEAVLAIYSLQAVFVCAAYVLRYESAALILGFYAALALALIAMHPLGTRLRWRLHRWQGHHRVSWLAHGVRELQQRQWLNKYPYYSVTLLIVGFLIVVALKINTRTPDLGYLSLAILILGATLRFFASPSMSSRLRSLIIYTGAILMIYLLNTQTGAELAEFQSRLKWFFLLLALLLAVGVRYSGREYFSLSTSDYLVMFILLASAYMPTFENSARLALEAAVMLYGVEYVKRRGGLPAHALWYGANAGFALVAARVFL